MSLNPMELGYDEELRDEWLASDYCRLGEFKTHLGDGDTSDERIEVVVPSEKFNELAEYEVFLSAIALSHDPVDESFRQHAEEYHQLILAGTVTLEEVLELHKDRFEAEQLADLLGSKPERVSA